MNRENQLKVGRLLELISGGMFAVSRILFNLPSLSSNKMKQLIDETRGRPEEEDEKSSLEIDFDRLKRRDKSTFSILLMATLGIVYSLKIGLLMNRKMSIFDYSDFGSNFDYSYDVMSNRTLVHFTCMTTNCSRLSAGGANRSLAEDLTELPTFDICDPTLALFYPSPLKYIEKICLLLFAFFAYGNFYCGFFMGMFLLVSPRPNECSLFVESPRLASALARNRVRSIVTKVFQSRGICLPRHNHSPWQRNSQQRTVNRYLQGINGSLFDTTDRQLHVDEDNYSRRESYLADEKLIVACSPVVRSDWFHRKLVILSCVFLFSLIFNVIGLFYMGLVSVVEQESARRAKLFAGFEREMQAQSCSIWVMDDQARFVNVTGFYQGWNWLATAETALGHFGSSAIICLFFIVFSLTALELICWQSELQNQLLFLLEFRRLSSKLTTKYHRRTSTTFRRLSNGQGKVLLASPGGPQRQQALLFTDITMGKLREKFMQANSFSLFAIQTNLIRTKHSFANNFSSSRLDTALAFQNLSLEALRLIGSVGRDHQVETDEVLALLNERIYVNFCLYLEHMNHYKSSLSVAIGQCYTVLFGLILVTIWYVVKISTDHFSALIAMVSLTWFYNNYTLLICSVVHAKVSY